MATTWRFGKERLTSSIPNVGTSSPDAVLNAMKEWIEVRQGARGDGLDRAVTVRDLLNSGVLTVQNAGAISTAITASPGIAAVADPAIPPTPTGLIASGAVATVLLTWTFAKGYSRLANFEIWRSATDAIGDASLVAQPGGTVYADSVDPGASWYYWVRAVSDAGTSPFNALSGVLGQTSLDPSHLIESLTSTDPTSLLYKVPVETTINGVVVPAGVYIRDLYVANGSMTNLKIANLAVDDAKIANVSVAKLLAGQLSVSEFIESTGYAGGDTGFHIAGNGDAEFNNAVVRGTVYAAAGQIGANTIDATGVQSASYSATVGWRIDSSGTFTLRTGTVAGNTIDANGIQSPGYNGATGWRLNNDGSVVFNSGTFRGNLASGQYTTGAMTGYAWPAAGQYGTYLGPSGLLIGNANNGTFFQVDSHGNVYAPGFSVVNGVLSISQINVIGTLNIAGQAVTVPVSYFGNSGSATLYITVSAATYVTIVCSAQNLNAGSTSGGSGNTGIYGVYVNGSYIGNALSLGISTSSDGAYTSIAYPSVCSVFSAYIPAGTSSITVNAMSDTGGPVLLAVAAVATMR